ncbi:MAG: GlsB/YeaQ/YmgE family stress response membrane protein [Planctomycetaceae bacterium]
MTLVSLLLLLLIAGVCGSLAQGLVGYSRGGCLVSIALGFIGAILGTWLAGLFGVGEILAIQIGGQSFPIVWSIIGAALFVALLNLLKPRRQE